MESDLKKVGNLLSAGVDVNESFWNNGNTPLHIAAKDDDTNLLVLLLKYNPKLDSKNDNGFTPLFLAAAISGNADTCKILIDAGATVNITDVFHSPIHWAARNNHQEVYELLMSI